jgi:phosphatidylglycerophosphate synthase
VLEQKRESFKKIEQGMGRFFSKFGLSANQYTLFSLISVAVSFYFLIQANLILALFFFLSASLLDLVDGAVARITGTATKKGAYIDTVCDRYVEGIILLGFLFLPLSTVILPPKVWIFSALMGALMTTYSKAAAKEKGLVVEELKEAFFSRGERIVLICLAMLLGFFNFSMIIYPIIILAIFSNITVLQRIYLSLNQRD